MRLLAALCIVLAGCSLITRTDKGDLEPGGDGGVPDRDTGPPPRDTGPPDPDAGPGGADRCTDPGNFALGSVLMNDTTDLRDDVRLACTREARNSPDAVYRFHTDEVESVSFDTFDSGFDTVMAIRTACTDEGSELACANDANGEGTTRIIVRGLRAGDYYLLIEGDGAAPSGPLTVHTSGGPWEQSTCGDPIRIDGGAAIFGRLPGRWSNSQTGSCGGNHSPEEAFAFDLPRTAHLVAHTIGSTKDTVLYLRGASCSSEEPGNEIACDDNGGGGIASMIETDLPPGRYHLILDGADGRLGEYRLVVFINEL